MEPSHIKPEKVGRQVDAAVSLTCLGSEKKLTCLLLSSLLDVMQQHSRVYMESHAFRIEIYRPVTRITTTKQGLRRNETRVITQSGGECKDDRQ